MSEFGGEGTQMPGYSTAFGDCCIQQLWITAVERFRWGDPDFGSGPYLDSSDGEGFHDWHHWCGVIRGYTF